MKMWSAIVIALIVTWLGPSASAGPAIAINVPELSKKEVDKYLKIADELSRYKRPMFRRPIVLLIPDDYFIGMACGLRGIMMNYCPIMGFFRPSTPNMIYLRDADWLEPSYKEMVLVHELVHWLQYDSGWVDDFDNCIDSNLHEVEAYLISYMFAVKYQGATTNFYLPSGFGCPQPEKE